MPRKKGEPATDPAVRAANTTSRRALVGGIAAALITVAGGIVVAVINGWFGSRNSSATPEAGIYRVRVTVMGDQKIPIEDAQVWSSFGGEPKRVAGGWQFDIPAASKPNDGKITVFASKESAFLTGEKSFILDKELNHAVIVTLRRDTSAKVRGQVVDSRNRAAVGVRVFVVGYESEAVITKEGGNFELPAHAAVGQKMTIHAEKIGYRGANRIHPAGDAPLIMVLER
jgi:hypothetical protein